MVSRAVLAASEIPAIQSVQLAASTETLEKEAHLAWQDKDWPRAVGLYKQLSILEPKNALHHQNLADAYLKLGQRANAIGALREAIALNDAAGNRNGGIDRRSHSILCYLLFAEHRIPEAIAACQTDLDRNPDTLLGRAYLGHAYVATGDYAKAEEQYLNLLPQIESWFWLHAEVLTPLQDMRSSEQQGPAVQSLINKINDAWRFIDALNSLVTHAVDLESQGNPEEASRFAQHTIDQMGEVADIGFWAQTHRETIAMLRAIARTPWGRNLPTLLNNSGGGMISRGCTSVSDGSNLLAVSNLQSQLVDIWQIPSGRIVRRIDLGGECRKIQFLNDQRLLVATERRLRLLDIRTGHWVWQRPVDSFPYLEISGNLRRATVNAGGSGRVIDLATGDELIQFPQQTTGKFALSYDGRFLATANEEEGIRLLDTEHRPLSWRKIAHPQGRIGTIALNSDGTHLATFDESKSDMSGFVTVWSTAEGSKVATYPSRVYVGNLKVGFFANDKLLLIPTDGALIQWNPQTNESSKFPLKDPDDRLLSYRLGRNDHLIALVSKQDDGIVLEHDLSESKDLWQLVMPQAVTFPVFAVNADNATDAAIGIQKKLTDTTLLKNIGAMNASFVDYYQVVKRKISYTK